MTMDDTFDPLDEVLSAYLDGEATPEERALVEGDPELLARVQAMGRVSGILRDVEIDPTERDATISAALAAFGTAEPAEADGEAAAPASIAAARQARARRVDRTRRLVGWLGAAAAVGVAVVALGGTMQGDDEESATVAADPAARTEMEATGAADVAASSDTLAAIEAGADAAGAGAPSETTAAAAEEMATAMVLPAFDTREQVADYVRDGVAAGTLAALPTPPTTIGGVERYCTLPGGLDSVQLGPVLYQGQPGELVVAPSLEAPTRAVVLDASCKNVLLTVELTEG